jgi:hypothetical protein
VFRWNHYISYIRLNNIWVKFDDTRVGKIGAGHYFDVLVDILSGKYRPVLVVYEVGFSDAEIMTEEDWLRLEAWSLYKDAKQMEQKKPEQVL